MTTTLPNPNPAPEVAPSTPASASTASAPGSGRGAGAGFTFGSIVFVRRWSCLRRSETDWPPTRTEETYHARVDRISHSGDMLYLTDWTGQERVVFADECRPASYDADAFSRLLAQHGRGPKPADPGFVTRRPCPSYLTDFTPVNKRRALNYRTTKTKR